MKNNFQILNLFTLLAALVSACSPQDTASENETINEYLVNLSDRMNKQLPDMADENTVLESTSGYNNQFFYYYTLLNYSADTVDADAFVNQMKPVLLQNACSSQVLDPLFSKGVTINYIYSDKDFQEFAAIAVTPEEC